MQNLIKQIEYNHGHFHRNELEEIIARREEAIPALLKLMAEIRDNPEKSIEDPEYFGHIYATYILAQFRVKEAYPIFVDMLSMPGEIPFDLYGDTITEDAGRILASLYDDDIAPIKELIEDVDVNEYVRRQAADSLNILVTNHKLSIEYVLAYYQELLEGVLSDMDFDIMNHIRGCRSKLIIAQDDESLIIFERYDRLIDDAIKELEGWACFPLDVKGSINKPVVKNNQETVFQPRAVQRNEFCPCGSGMKYKKCCGKQFE